MLNQYLISNFSVLETFLANLTSMLIDNPRYQHIYNAIANFNKADPYKSKGVELARLNQLNK